jgi:hypothetical protein
MRNDKEIKMSKKETTKEIELIVLFFTQGSACDRIASPQETPSLQDALDWLVVFLGLGLEGAA